MMFLDMEIHNSCRYPATHTNTQNKFAISKLNIVLNKTTRCNNRCSWDAHMNSTHSHLSGAVSYLRWYDVLHKPNSLDLGQLTKWATIYLAKSSN